MDIQFILNNNNNNKNNNNNNSTTTTTTTTTTTQPLLHIQVFPPINNNNNIKLPRASLKNINNNSLNSSFNNVNMYIQSYNNSDQSSLVEDVSDETIINTIASLKNKSTPTSPISTTPNFYSTQTTPIQSPLVSSSCHSPSKVPISNINSNNIFNVQHQQHINFINNSECNNFSDEESELDMSDDCCFPRRDEPSSPMMQVPNSPNCNDPFHPIVGKTRNTNGTLSANGKKPRKSYEVYKKLEILEEKNQFGMNFVVKKYHISRSIISRWISNIDKYKSFGKKNLKKLHKGPKASFSMEQENLIIEKINQARANGEIVSGETIKKFALDLSKQLNNNTFKASSGWLENFKMRNNINLTGLTKSIN